jgi:uncharacterized protein (TIGR02231 family)
MSDIVKKIVEQESELDMLPSGKVSEVMIYTDRAKVTRTRNVELKEGRQTLSFQNLSPLIDDSSIKAGIPNALKDKVNVIGIQTKDKAIAYFPREEERAVYNQILDEIINLLEKMDSEAILEVEKNILRELSDYAKDFTYQFVNEKNRTIEELSTALDYISGKMKNLDKDLYDTRIEEQDIREKLNILIEKLNHIRTPRYRSLKNINIEVEVKNLDEKESVTDKLSISYMVYNVSWLTTYDARVVQGKNDKTTVDLTCYAIITQKTGEDWTDAHISLTTAKPESAQIPDIYPYYFTGYKREKQDKQIISQESQIFDEFSEAPMESEEEVEGDIGAVPVDETEYSDVTKGDFHTVFKLDGKNTILSDGNSYSLTVFEHIMDTDLSYETIPKMIEYVYLKGEMVNNTGRPMLGGKVNIFRNKGYIGSGHIDYHATDEKFDLSFGIDENIKVRRITLLDELKRDKLGFKQRRIFGYDIELKSFKENEEEVVIKENIPVSELKEVKVKLKDETTKGYELDEKEGIVSWKVKVSMGDKKHFKLYYEVEAGKDFHLDYI